MDLYPFAVVFYGLLVIASLASLKSTIKRVNYEERIDNQTKNKLLMEKKRNTESVQTSKSESCKIFKYLLKNHTFLLIFRGKTGIQLLTFLLEYSAISIYVFYTKFWYPALGFGCIISSVSIILLFLQEKSRISQKSSNNQQKSAKWKVKKILFILIGLANIGIFLSLVGLCYRYYINSQLKAMFINFGLIFAIDNLAVKPFILLTIALITGQNQHIINLVNRQQQQNSLKKVRVANTFQIQPETKQHFVLNFEIQPQPIDLNRSKQFNKIKKTQEKNSSVNQPLPSASIVDTIQVQHHEASVENMLSRVQSRKSQLNKLTSMKELNEIDLQKIEQHPGHELQQYFCMNLRRQRQEDQKKQMESKVDGILQNKTNVQTSDLIKQFIFEDFVCNSPKNDEVNHSGTHEQPKSSKYSKSKGSLRGTKTFRIIQRQNDVELNDKENTNEESTKHEISYESTSITKDPNYASHRRIENKTHILKISDTQKQSGQLEQIDINSPNKRAIQKTYYDTHVIPQETIKIKHKRHRRGTTKDISQPYLLQDKLIETYFPGRNRSQIDNFIRSKKKSNFDRSQFFNHSNKKEEPQPKGRQKPIVHESDENHTQFFVPKF